MPITEKRIRTLDLIFVEFWVKLESFFLQMPWLPWWHLLINLKLCIKNCLPPNSCTIPEAQQTGVWPASTFCLWAKPVSLLNIHYFILKMEISTRCVQSVWIVTWCYILQFFMNFVWVSVCVRLCVPVCACVCVCVHVHARTCVSTHTSQLICRGQRTINWSHPCILPWCGSQELNSGFSV